MFGLFKRTKIEEWEIDLLRNTIQLLPNEYKVLEKQISEGLFRGVRIGSNYLPGYIGFTFNSAFVDKFENKKDREYKLTDIRVLDKRSKNYLKYSIYVYNGLIIGYSIEGAEKFTIDVNRIDVKTFKREYQKNSDYEKIAKHLTVLEKQVINQNEVYEVVLNDKRYFHIKDLEDGDFIGMDYKKNIYKITHDPFEIKPISCSLLDVFKSD